MDEGIILFKSISTCVSEKELMNKLDNLKLTTEEYEKVTAQVEEQADSLERLI